MVGIMAATACLTALIGLGSMFLLPSSGPLSQLDANAGRNTTNLENDFSQVKKEQSLSHNRLYEEGVQQNHSLFSVKQVKLWRNKTMPYIIDDYFLPEQKEIIQDVIDEFNRKSCVRMRPYRQGDRDYVLIQRHFFKSSSQIGRKGGAQVVNLMNCCGKRGQIIHELLHAWGFHHQHSVVGREKYIRINWENINEENIKNFLKQDSDDFGLPYDYDSVMHYDRFAFSKNNEPTIEPLVEGVEIGQRNGFSEMDIIKLNMLYDCPFVFKNSTNSEIKRTDR